MMDETPYSVWSLGSYSADGQPTHLCKHSDLDAAQKHADWLVGPDAFSFRAEVREGEKVLYRITRDEEEQTSALLKPPLRPSGLAVA